jgi:16S rRNA (adenine1518-N6/adenine1519-N6)-dimethyltransferase
VERHQPRKRFGQNFLVERHYIDRIVAAIDPKPGDNVVEIGPGLGALTRPLLERVQRLSVIEIDRDLATRLSAEFPPERLVLHRVDALTFDFAALGDNLRVVGNLPYNISSPLLFHLAQYDSSLRDITVMLQKEVVQRIAAAPASAEYGRLSVMLQVRFRVERLFVVPPGAFRPSPKVESAVARLTPLGAARPRIADAALFARLVAAAFGQRRKTLRNALHSLASEAELEREGIAPGARGETLAVGDFVRLANALAAKV